MSVRYISQRYPSNQRVLPATSFHGGRNLTGNRRSPYFRDEIDWTPDDVYSSSDYSRDGRHISDHHIRERSISPRNRNIPSRRSQEPDLRDLLIASQYNRKLAEIERECPNYNRSYKDYELVNQNSDWKYDRNVDMKTRMDQDLIDQRNREFLSRRDYRDEKYLFDSGRDRSFSDLRDEKFDLQRGRYSPDHRDKVYLPEPRREDPFGYRDKMYLTDSRLDTLPSDFRRETHLSDFRKGWLSPEHRDVEPSERWHNDQHYRDLERNGRYPDQHHPNYDMGCSDPRYQDPSIEYWRDQLPEQRYERNNTQATMSTRDDLNEFNHQGRGMDYRGGDGWKDYKGEDNWMNRHPSHWKDKGTVFNLNNSEPDGRKFSSFKPVNNAIPNSDIPKNPFVNNASLPRKDQEEGAPLPKLTVLIQYLYNFHQPLSEEHIEYVKEFILRHWSEDKMKRRKGSWLPSFLECIPRNNGLAIVCADKPSFTWLLNMKIKGCGKTHFAATDAAMPIKRVKLFFQVPDTGITAVAALKKFQWCNRGNQISFDRFKVVSCKKSGGNLNIIVSSDSWSVTKLKKKLNWRPLYGDRRIRMNLLQKKRKKPPSVQPGEVKQPKNELDEFDEMDEDSESESYDEL